MKNFIRRLLLLTLSVLILTSSIPANAESINSSLDGNWERIYDNPTGAYNGEEKTWNTSGTSSYPIPEWSSLKKPEFNVKIFGDINAPVKKGEAALLFLRIWQNMLGDIGYSPMTASFNKPPFKDLNNFVPKAQDEISILYDKTIINGTRRDDVLYLNFGDDMKRCELATILSGFEKVMWRFPRSPNQFCPFNDIWVEHYSNNTFHWAYSDIVYIFNKGLMSGVSKKEFNPDGFLSIAEVCEIAIRLIGTNGITSKNVFEEIGKIFPVISENKFTDIAVKKAPKVTSIKVTTVVKEYPNIPNEFVDIDIYPIEALKYLDIRLIDENVYGSGAKCTKFDFDPVYINSLKPNTPRITLTSLVPGMSTLQVRVLDGSNAIYKTAVNPKPIDYREYQIKEPFGVVFEKAGEIETDVSKMPNNYDLFPYILKGIDSSIYELPHLGTEWLDPKQTYKKYGYLYTNFAAVLQTYYNTMLNVDYETIEFQSFKNGLCGVAVSDIDGSVKRYIEYVKEHKIKTKGSVEIYLPITYCSEFILVRCRIKMDILNADTDRAIMFADQLVPGYSYNSKTFDFIADSFLNFDKKPYPVPAVFGSMARTYCPFTLE